MELFTEGLQEKKDVAKLGFVFWERKTLNLHRGILEGSVGSWEGLDWSEANLRQVAKEAYRPSWWRGFGFGVLLRGASGLDISHLCEGVDAWNRSAGVLQWMIIEDRDHKTVFASHMWAEGYLTKHWLRTLANFQRSGYRVESSQGKTPEFFAWMARLQEFM
ncbi:MAG: hypothetical protein IPN71_08995 [Fibrobacteres bacterium]|nr:hypothetical protein [Fibrobacterota bacterium]